jgi:hypothetical protein
MVKLWKPKLADASESIKLANDFLLAFRKGTDLPHNFFQHLQFFCRTLPGIFRCHIHDIYQLLHTFKGNLSYERAGFLKPEAHVWDRAEIGVVEAGYWRAHDFSAPEAVEWRKNGVTDALTAAEWHLAGFPSQEAAIWIQVRFSPLLALQWASAGYNPEEAAILVGKEYHYPTDLTRQQAEAILSGDPQAAEAEGADETAKKEEPPAAEE